MKQNKQMKKRGIKHFLRPHINWGKLLFQTFLSASLFSMFSVNAFAATDMWTKATQIMQSVYNNIVLISTIAAVVTAAVALLLMNFSKNGRTVDESRSWLKRIIITWVVLNGLGFIMAYIAPFFSDGKWNG